MFKKNEKYAAIAFYSFITISGCALIILGILNFSYVRNFFSNVYSVLSPFVYGLIIAYICNPMMKFYEKKVFTFKKSEKPRLKRALSLTCTIITFLLLITVMIYAVIPQIVTSYEDFIGQTSSYITSVQSFADKIVSELPPEITGGEYESLGEFLEDHDIKFSLGALLTNSFSLLQTAFNYVIAYGSKFVGGVKNALLGIIIAIYFLASKEKLCAQVKKILAAFTTRRGYLNVIRLARFTDKTFGGFIIGKLLDSLIIGILTCIVLWFFKIPYYPLISVIVGVTNVIPFFGPFFGAIPSAFIIFIASPAKALLFVLLIFLIQQLDGNVIGPKILGDSIGISSLWVVISILVCGGFFGFAGMLLGVPTVAVCYALFKQYVERRLQHKNAPSGTNFYKTDPPADDCIDPGYIFIDRDVEVPAPCAADDLPADPPRQKKSTSSIKSIITKIKEQSKQSKGKNK